jgi:tRNA (guanine-N7-)-methyltransferase
METVSQSGSLIYELRSIVQPLELAEIFPKPQPLEVELGCGDSSFLVDYAKLHPEKNFLGVERLLGRLRKLDRKGRRIGLKNVRGVRIESAYFLEYLLPKNSVAALHVYFPDPWPKRKHWKNRLINDYFPQLAREVLIAGGVIYLRTDDQNYFEQMQSVFALSKTFRPVEMPEKLMMVRTDFEKGFNDRGIATLRTAYQRE